MFEESLAPLDHVADYEINNDNGNAILTIILNPNYYIGLTDPEVVPSDLLPSVINVVSAKLPENSPFQPVTFNKNVGIYTSYPEVSINFFEIKDEAIIPDPLTIIDILDKGSQLVSKKKSKVLNYSSNKYKHYFPIPASNKPVSKVAKDVTNKVVPQIKKKEISKKK